MVEADPIPESGGDVGVIPRGLRLLSLKQACQRRGIAPRTYYADRTLLPDPVRQTGPTGRVSTLFFAEHEVDALIANLLTQRN